jgi:hypothetical protein
MVFTNPHREVEPLKTSESAGDTTSHHLLADASPSSGEHRTTGTCAGDQRTEPRGADGFIDCGPIPGYDKPDSGAFIAPGAVDVSAPAKPEARKY